MILNREIHVLFSSWKKPVKDKMKTAGCNKWGLFRLAQNHPDSLSSGCKKVNRNYLKFLIIKRRKSLLSLLTQKRVFGCNKQHCSKLNSFISNILLFTYHFISLFMALFYNKYHQDKTRQFTGLQITVGHRTLADQNLLVSDKIRIVVRHDVRTIFDHKS